MTDEALNTIIKDLKMNPVFNMSLSGKEIFHSNVLAWLLSETNKKEPTTTAKNLSEIFCPRDENNNPIKQKYRVLTVFREKNNFDLLIVYLQEDEYQKFIKARNDAKDDNEKINIEDAVEPISIKKNNSQFLEKQLNCLKNCKFVVIENKFKAIPDKKQLDGYFCEICGFKLNREKNWNNNRNIILVNVSYGDKIKLDGLYKKNTTCYLLAPQEALNLFEKKSKKYENKIEIHYKDKQEQKEKLNVRWTLVSYEELVGKNSNNDQISLPIIKPEGQNKNILNDYIKFTRIMLDLSKDAINVDNNTEVYSFEKTAKKLKTIRIHDFYEKLWFSAVNKKITDYLDKTIKDKDYETHLSYSNGMGMLNYKYTFSRTDLKEARYGIEIQGKQFRIFVHTDTTESKEIKWVKSTNKKNEKQKVYYPEIFDWLYQIYEKADFPDKKLKDNLDLGRFDEFKYLKFNLDTAISVEKLSKMICITIQSMKDQENKFLAKLN